ncbi:hypothetical protein [Gimesia sp.]|uniref:hypothetical protein n=1 Tax=Gimesia sp. TaxID=2024833 RepID=UPI000C39F0AB|nr:hypothetical protein [Gimesia sp.]MAX34952.1 hypothetical protein [Gimesia sp.]HBL42787.1 hypothetical protein [Planctomycetaceae bacterium]|tara:strand:- start:99 stop:599 length:501 start_codon:yes stop_codon:yes gene_type:complete
MKTYQNRNRNFEAIVGAGVILAMALAISLQSLTFAQESAKAKSDKEMGSESMCPMMAGLKAIMLSAGSPPLLIPRADELKLTKQQKQELKSIAEEAQRKATKVLTEEQESMLGEPPDKAMTMMEVVMIQTKNMRDAKSGGMCPMCMEKIEGMRKGRKNDREDSTPN